MTSCWRDKELTGVTKAFSWACLSHQHFHWQKSTELHEKIHAFHRKCNLNVNPSNKISYHIIYGILSIILNGVGPCSFFLMPVKKQSRLDVIKSINEWNKLSDDCVHGMMIVMFNDTIID